MKLVNITSIANTAIAECGFSKVVTVVCSSMAAAFLVGAILTNVLPNNPKC